MNRNLSWMSMLVRYHTWGASAVDDNQYHSDDDIISRHRKLGEILPRPRVWSAVLFILKCWKHVFQEGACSVNSIQHNTSHQLCIEYLNN